MSSQMRHDFEQTLQILNYVSLMEGLKKWEFFMRFVIKGGWLSRVPFSFFVLKKHSKNTVKGKGQIHIEVFVTGVQMCGWGAAIEGPAVF